MTCSITWPCPLKSNQSIHNLVSLVAGAEYERALSISTGVLLVGTFEYDLQVPTDVLITLKS